MRARPLLLALLVALAPISVAQGDGSEGSEGESSEGSSTTSSSSSTSGSPAHDPPPGCPSGSNATSNASAQAECKQRFCAEHPGDPRCPQPAPKTDDADGDGADEGDDDANIRQGERWCRANEGSAESLERCRRLLQEFRDGLDDDHWVTFRVDPQNLTILDLRVAGRLVARSLVLDPGEGNVSVDRHGKALRVGDNDTELLLHDDPTGLLRFKGADGSVLLTFDEGVNAQVRNHGARIDLGSGREGLLVAENATWLAGNVVRLSGFFTFHVPVRGAAAEVDPQHPKAVEAGERVQDAIERRHVAVEVSLKAPEASDAAPVAGDTGPAGVEILAYDDVQVMVDEASLADPASPIRIEVSSELDAGRTLVFHLDDSLLASGDPNDLALRYFDLHNQTDGTVLETEVVLSAASSLTDILDPTDDGGAPEYWIVEDAEGMQVLFSVPHWSAHAITIASLSGLAGAPSVVVGFVIGAAGAVTAAAMMFWPRRREDDEF